MGSRNTDGHLSDLLLIKHLCGSILLYLAKQQELCFREQQVHFTLIPFRMLLHNMFSVMISVIGLDLAHMLLLIPRYDFGSHDGNASRRPGQEHQEGGKTTYVLTTLQMLIQVSSSPLLVPPPAEVTDHKSVRSLFTVNISQDNLLYDEMTLKHLISQEVLLKYKLSLEITTSCFSIQSCRSRL